MYSFKVMMVLALLAISAVNISARHIQKRESGSDSDLKGAESAGYGYYGGYPSIGLGYGGLGGYGGYGYGSYIGTGYPYYSGYGGFGGLYGGHYW